MYPSGSLDIQCTTCGVAPGEKCKRTTRDIDGFNTFRYTADYPHKNRARLAEIKSLTCCDKPRDCCPGCHRTD